MPFCLLNCFLLWWSLICIFLLCNCTFVSVSVQVNTQRRYLYLMCMLLCGFAHTLAAIVSILWSSCIHPAIFSYTRCANNLQKWEMARHSSITFLSVFVILHQMFAMFKFFVNSRVEANCRFKLLSVNFMNCVIWQKGWCSLISDIVYNTE